MTIAASDVKKLRDQTGAGMMRAKEALEAADGNFDKAILWLREKGEMTAAKKADREARAGLIESYVHSGRIGVLVEINCETDFVAMTPEFKEFARDVAMHIAAANPEYLNSESVPEAIREQESALYRREAEGKPSEVVEKIVQGKLDKFYAGVCLVNQPFVKDPDVTIGKLTTQLIAKLGENIVIRRFERLELGGQ
jgi:elongation factor Ts